MVCYRVAHATNKNELSSYKRGCFYPCVLQINFQGVSQSWMLPSCWGFAQMLLTHLLRASWVEQQWNVMPWSRSTARHPKDPISMKIPPSKLNLKMPCIGGHNFFLDPRITICHLRCCVCHSEQLKNFSRTSCCFIRSFASIFHFYCSKCSSKSSTHQRAHWNEGIKDIRTRQGYYHLHNPKLDESCCT